MRPNDRTVYDSDGNIVCRPIVALGTAESDIAKERDTLPGMQAALILFAPREDFNEHQTESNDRHRNGRTSPEVDDRGRIRKTF